MKRFLALTCAALMLAPAAHAACYAEYKAKRDAPLQLHYDVAQISGPCTVQSATAQLNRRLAAQGLTLLKVLTVTEQ